jgi:hypothetical protein
LKIDMPRTDCRALVVRLDTATGTVGRWASNADTASTSPIQPPPSTVREAQPGTPSAAPVFLIRDVASEVGVRRPDNPRIQISLPEDWFRFRKLD